MPEKPERDGPTFTAMFDSPRLVSISRLEGPNCLLFYSVHAHADGLQLEV